MRFPSPPCNLEDSVESSSSTSTATSANLIPQYIVLTVNPVSVRGYRELLDGRLRGQIVNI